MRLRTVIPVPVAPFRDLLIAASLKRTRHHRPSRRAPSLPRSIDRGLIEAAWRTRTRRYRPCTLPRSIDRGLIEATSRRESAIRSGYPFRDLLIAASLKLGQPRGHRYFDVPLPRSIDRGLIEARIRKKRRPAMGTLPRSIDRGLIEAVARRSLIDATSYPSAIY